MTGLKPRLVILFMVLTLAPAARARAEYRTGGVVKTILSNGLTILVKPEPEARVAAIEIFIRVGAADEGSSNSGIGHLVAGSILAGTKSRSALKLARLVSEVGGNFHAAWHWDYLEVYAVTMPEMCEDAISLLADSIQDSAFQPAAVECASAAIEKEWRAAQDDPFTAAYTAVRRLVHGDGPYGRPYLGDPEKVKTITREELLAFYERHFVARNTVVSVVGDVDPERISRKVRACFGSMRCSSKSGREPQRASTPGYTRSTAATSASTTYLMIGFPAAGMTDPDYPALCVANVLLGGSKSSLLFTKLREERGLGYHVGSVYPALRGGSHIVAFVGTDSARAASAEVVENAILEQVAALKNGEFTGDDLERAKRFLIGTHAIRHERTRDRAFYLGWHETAGLGYRYDFLYADKIKDVTKEDILRACSRFLDKPSLVVLEGTGG